MLVTLIAAVSDDGIIGQEGRIPWALPRDVAHLRAYCAGKLCLVGRRTEQAMEGWFQGPTPLVLTRQFDYQPVVGQPVSSVGAALKVAAEQSAAELVVLGGGAVFTLLLPYAQQLILTQVHTKVGHGTRFPDWSTSVWRSVRQQTFPADPQHAYSHTISTYQRTSLDPT